MSEPSKFSYKPDIPDELMPGIKRLFEQFAYLVPAWCEQVAIHWDSEGDGDDCAQTTTHFAYRWASVSLFPMFWDQSKEKREVSVVHELLHISISPLADYACFTFETLLKEENPKFHDHVQAELVVRHEGAVQDLARIIKRLRKKD